MPGCTFLFCTDPAVTYNHPTVLLLWRALWVVAAGSLTLLLAWGGITLIMREHLNPRWATWRELMPRLVIATLAASTSLWWGSLVIDLNNGIIGYIRSAVLSDGSYLLFWNIGLWSQLLTAQPWQTLALYVALLIAMLFYGFFYLLLVVQLFIRLALLDTLLVLSPVGLVLWVLPQTAGWSAWWLRLFMVTVFQQAVQVVVLTLGTLFLLDVREPLTPSQVLLAMPIGIAILYLATRAPSLMERATGNGVVEGWSRSLTLPLMVYRTFRGGSGAASRALTGGPSTPGGGPGAPGRGSGGPGPAPAGGAPALPSGPLITGGGNPVSTATALASDLRLSLPPPAEAGPASLDDDSRMTRILLDLSHTLQARRRE